MTHEAGSPFSYPASLSCVREEPEPSGLDSVVPEIPLVIDCDSCQVRGTGCGDCFVTVLLGGPPEGVTLNDEERRAVDVLAAAGMIPPIRHVYGVATPFLERE